MPKSGFYFIVYCFCVCMHARLVMSDSVTLLTVFSRLLCSWIFFGKNTEAGCHCLLQGIITTQGSKMRLLCLLYWQTGSLPAEPAIKLTLYDHEKYKRP